MVDTCRPDRPSDPKFDDTRAVDRITFATLASPGASLRQAILLARSLRRFGGALAANPIRVLVPESAGPIHAAGAAALEALDVTVSRFPIDPELKGIAFGTKVSAAAHAERSASGELLCWLDSDTLVLREPATFVLPPPISLGSRPVHHRLIGIPWGVEPDRFWSAVFDLVGVPDAPRDPMTTHVGEQIRPYLTAGCFVVRSERRMVAAWSEALRVAAADRELAGHCARSELHAVFLHQVVFTATMLREAGFDAMADLGVGVNYPLHLHDDVPAHLRPASVDDLTTARYEDSLSRAERLDELPIGAQLRRWIESNSIDLGSTP